METITSTNAHILALVSIIIKPNNGYFRYGGFTCCVLYCVRTLVYDMGLGPRYGEKFRNPPTLHCPGYVATV